MAATFGPVTCRRCGPASKANQCAKRKMKASATGVTDVPRNCSVSQNFSHHKGREDLSLCHTKHHISTHTKITTHKTHIPNQPHTPSAFLMPRLSLLCATHSHRQSHTRRLHVRSFARPSAARQQTTSATQIFNSGDTHTQRKCHARRESARGRLPT